MVREINSGGVNLNAPPQNDKAARGAASSGQPAAPAPAQPRAAADSVSLSSNAQTLQGLAEKLQKQPDVNEKRVAEIRAALESGNYQVDDLVLADKLLAADDLLK